MQRQTYVQYMRWPEEVSLSLCSAAIVPLSNATALMVHTQIFLFKISGGFFILYCGYAFKNVHMCKDCCFASSVFGQLNQQFVQGSHDPYGHAHEQTFT